MSFDAGALTFKLQTTGAQVFQREVSQSEREVDRLGKTSQSAAANVAQAGQATERAGGAARDARGRFIAQADATRRVGDESAAAAPQVKTLSERIKATEGEMRTVGASFVGVGAALATATGLTAKAAIDWETAWAGVTKTVEGTPEQMQEIEDGLRGLAKELPSSHSEIAAVAEAAGQLGVKSADVVAFTKVMIDLGQTTNLSAEVASTALAQFMNIMGTAGQDVGRLGATIVALGNDGASTEAEIVAMSQRIAGAGKLVGATEGEVLALANALASMGVTAELGGGVASRILQDLYSAVQTGGDKLDGFAKVAGVSAKDFATAFTNDPVRAMGAFATGLNGIEASGGNVVQTLSDLGFKSSEEQRVLLQLKSGGDLLTDSLELQNTAWKDNTALTDEAAKRYATTESKIKAAGNSIVDAAIDFGQVFLPVISEVSSVIKTVADGFGDLPEPVQAVVSVVGALGAVVLLTSGALLLAIPKIVEYRAALTVLATSNLPLVSAAAATMGAGVTKASGALGAMATFLKGPWGLAFIAAAIAVAALNNEIQKGQPTAADLDNALKTAAGSAALLRTATERSGTEQFFMGDYADSLKEVNALLEKRSGDGFLDFLNLTGNQRGALDSLSKIGDQLAPLVETDLSKAQESFRGLAKELGVSEKNMYGLIDSMPAYRDALIEQATAQDINLAGLSEEERQLKLVELAKGDGTAAASTATEAYMQEAEAVEDLHKQLSELLDKLMESNAANSDAISANIAYQEALAAADEQIRNVTEGAEGYAAGLDLSTDAGRRNTEILQSLASTSQEAAKAQFDLDGNTANYKATLEAGRQAVYDRALALTGNADAAQLLTDKIYAIPSEASFTMVADTSNAQAKIESVNQSIRDAINLIANMPLFNPGGGTSSGRATIAQADGGVVEYFANGGLRREHHVAQIAAAGSMRVWAEPETGGEAYIPLAPAKRGRSTDILETVAQRFGYALVPRGAQQFADGGLMAAAAPSGASHTHQWTVYTNDPESLYQGFIRRTGNAGV